MKKQELPKFHETFNQILEILSDERILNHRELLKKVVENYYSDLPKELFEERTKSGEPLILNRIAWGKSYLRKGGYLNYPSRGLVQITEKGLKAKRERLELKDVVGDANFMDFYVDEKSKALTNNNQILTSTPEDLIETGYTKIESQVKSELLEKLKSLDPYFFEKVILILLKKMGYGEYTETSKSKDGGIDGIIEEDKLGLDKIYIQAKRYEENKVREKDIRNFIGAMSGDTNKGVFVTTSEFDKEAVQKAHDAIHTIILINGKKLVDLLYQFNVGIQTKVTYDIKQLDEDFFEN